MLEAMRLYLFENQLLPIMLVLMFGGAVFGGRAWGLYLKRRVSGGKIRPDEISVTAIFGLISLLVTFTFFGAYDRYDQRRSFLVDEYNTISTAYQSIDLLPEARQPQIREDFRDLMDRRMTLYKEIDDKKVFSQRHKDFEVALSRVWKDAVAAVEATPYPKNLVAAQLLTAISNMGDALEKRRMALNQHPPPVIYTLLLVMLIIGAFIAGYNQATTDSHDWTLVPVYVFLSVAIFYITVNLEHPLLGLITLDDYLVEIQNLRQTM